MNTEFLKELGLEQEAIAKIMAENGKDIAKEQKKTEAVKSELETKTAEIGELSEKVKTLETLEGSDKTIKELQQKVADFEAAEEKRREAEKADKENAALLATFEEISEGKTFVNDFTKNAIFESCKAELSKEDNKGKGLKDIFAALTTDKEGIFTNPNPPGDIPGTGSVNPEVVDDAKVRAVMGLPAKK